jgi:hypothetical protein
MSTKKTLYMESTEVPAERTAAEVSAELIKAGATQIATDYQNGKITGLRWTLRVNGIDALFQMPARVVPMYLLLLRRKGYGENWLTSYAFKDGVPSNRDQWEKAERVAWRQLLRWVQAQNAMIETGMVRPMEVFTAYWIPPGQEPGSERTLFEGLIERQFKALPSAKPE